MGHPSTLIQYSSAMDYIHLTMYVCIQKIVCYLHEHKNELHTTV